jgi:hypothetical protein
MLEIMGEGGHRSHSCDKEFHCYNDGGSTTQSYTKIYQLTDGDVNDKEDRQGERERCQICK